MHFLFLGPKVKTEMAESKDELRQQSKNLVLQYVKNNKLGEYQPPPDFKPDFEYIFTEHQFEKEELAALVKKFKLNLFEELYEVSEYLSNEEIIYLLENDAISIEDIISWMDGLAVNCFVGEALGEMVEYFLKKDYEITIKWIAALVYEGGHDELIEQIKKKYTTFTFDDIYGARDADSINTYSDNDAIKRFYVAVHEHFPDPDFEDPFADPYEHFERVSTDHVNDHLCQRYFYDDEEDKLSVVVGFGENRREIPMGGCKEMLKRDLSDLIEEYQREVKEYDVLNAKVSEGFDEMDEVNDDDTIKGEKKLYRKEDIWKCSLRDDLYERNDQANVVSKLYYVISMKSPNDDTEAEATDVSEQEEDDDTETEAIDVSEQEEDDDTETEATDVSEQEEDDEHDGMSPPPEKKSRRDAAIEPEMVQSDPADGAKQ